LFIEELASTLALKSKNPLLMKRRISHVFNFIAFSFLFVALYLNFFYKDSSLNHFPAPSNKAVQGSVHIENEVEKIQEPLQVNTEIKQTSALYKEDAALKLSYN